MKILVCRKCHDTVALGRKIRRCRCRKSGGVYIDDVRAKVTGPVTVFGINSNDIARWLMKTERGIYPEPYKGQIEAWCMPEYPTNIEYVDELTEAR